MQNFEYIDVAENAIRALEKISIEFGSGILSAGGLQIMINMIDFFVISTQVPVVIATSPYSEQKSIMNIISNIFRMVSSEKALTDQILPVIPTLMAYLVS